MEVVQAIILSVVEGVTEFLPISSTGHLILAGKALGIPTTDFSKSFDIIIQLGAILAVVVIFFKKLLAYRQNWGKIIVAFLPTAVIGLFVYPAIKKYLLGNDTLVAVSLILGGFVILVFEYWYALRKRKETSDEKMKYTDAVQVGLYQSVSMIPGVSRSGATIIGGMLTGMSRSAALEFSFFLAIPTMAAATGLDLLKSGFSFTAAEWELLGIGFTGSFVAALCVIKWLTAFVQKNTFKIFGVYRIILGILFLILMR